MAKNKIGEKHIDQVVLIIKATKNSLKYINLADNAFGSKMSKNRIRNALAKAGSGGRIIEVLI